MAVLSAAASASPKGTKYFSSVPVTAAGLSFFVTEPVKSTLFSFSAAASQATSTPPTMKPSLSAARTGTRTAPPGARVAETSSALTQIAGSTASAGRTGTPAASSSASTAARNLFRLRFIIGIPLPFRKFYLRGKAGGSPPAA